MDKSKYIIWLALWTSLLANTFAEEILLLCPTEFNVVRFKRENSEVKIVPAALVLDDYYDSKEDDPTTNCTLPANYTRTAVSHETQISFSSLMNGGFDALVNSSGHQDVILMMGNTGVGKTTITQMLAGDLNTIYAMYTHTQKLVIVDNAEKISAPSIVSRTLVPELVLKLNMDMDNESSQAPVAFYDCPGFDDTRGPAQDVATSFFMNQIINKVSRIKILFLVLHSSVELGHDRIDFDLMVQHATSFVKNVTDFKDSIGLVVTKVKSYNHQGKYLEDKYIMRNILNFLLSYVRTKHLLLSNSELDPKERVINTKKLEFVSILLEQNANGKFSKVSFSRDPEKCGPLSGSVEVSKTRARVTKLYESLEYGSVINKTGSFGFSLKQETKLKIISDYLPELNNETVNKISSLVNSFKSWFDEVKLATIGNYSTSVASDFNKVVNQVNLVLSNIVVNLRVEKSRGSSEKFVQFGIILKRGFSEIDYNIPENFGNFLEKQDKMFDFFEKVRGTNKSVRPISSWISSLSSLQVNIMEYKYWYQFCAELQNILTSYEFHVKKSTFGRIDAGQGQVNWLEYVERNNIISVDQNIKSLQTKFGWDSRQVRLLSVMMEYTTSPTLISCTSTTLTVEGHFVRFSEFLQGSTGRIRFPSSCSSISQSAKFTLEIYAANTIFIDENLNGMGLEINLVLISPKWEVVNRVNLNFDGVSAPQIYPGKATDGGAIHLHDGVAGQDGLAGKPGGPGGSFFGISNIIKGGNQMKISSNGGHGSAGQNGGNGGPGSHGRPPTKDDTYLENHYDIGGVDREWRKFWGHPGYPGGKGGDGGVGGWGGYPGLIKINSLKDSSALSVQKSLRKGNTGSGGLGGRGGTGGAPGSGMHCDKHRFFGFTRKDQCDLIPSNRSNAPDGVNGHDNKSRAGFQMPVASQYRISEAGSIMHFKTRFNAGLDMDVHKFAETLNTSLSNQG